MDEQIVDNLLHASNEEADNILAKVKETYFDKRKDDNDLRFIMIISALAYKSTKLLIMLEYSKSLDVLDNMIKEFNNKT